MVRLVGWRSETPEEAIAREFGEETGYSTKPDDWTKFATLHSDHGTTIHFLAIKLGNLHWMLQDREIRTATDERVVVYPVQCLRSDKVLPNLAYLVPMGWYAVSYQALGATITEGEHR